MSTRLVSLVTIFIVTLISHSPRFTRAFPKRPIDSSSGDSGSSSGEPFIPKWTREENEEGSGIASPHSPTCQRNIDIIFLLDVSDSVGPVGFKAIKKYAKQILSGLSLSICDNVGVVEFSRFASSQMFWGSREITANVIAKIDSIAGPDLHVPEELKESQLNIGLLLAEELLFLTQLDVKSSLEKLLVVITDGRQSQSEFTSDRISAENLAKRLTVKGVRLYVLAVGNDSSIPKLLKIVPKQRNIFNENNVDNLIAALLAPKDDCERKIDIGFLLDSSESIGPVTFKAVKNYTKEILQKIDVSKCDNVGLIKFDEFANSETYFGSHEIKSDIFSTLDALEGPLRFDASEVNGSNINLGLLVADEILFTEQLGSRQSSLKVLIIITDGHSTKQPFTNHADTFDDDFVKKLTVKGVRIFVLVVGNDVPIQELLKFSFEERNIFPAKQLDGLIQTLLSRKPLALKVF